MNFASVIDLGFASFEIAFSFVMTQLQINEVSFKIQTYKTCISYMKIDKRNL